MSPFDEALTLALAFALVYNNALVVLGPSAWGGVQPDRALILATASEIAGTFLSPMSPLRFSPPEYLAALLFYAAFTAARISLPISVFLYSLRGLTATSLALWFGTPALAFTVGYLAARLVRPSLALGYVVLFAVSFMFGANNIAFVDKDVYVVAAIFLGNYLGLRFSRWIMKLYAFSFSGAVSASASAAALAALGIAFGIPMSFTLLIYSTLLGSAASRRMRIIRPADFIKALASITSALLLAYATSIVLGRA